MTPEEIVEFRRGQKEIVKFITENPSQFCVCEGCEVIVDATGGIGVCPRCGSYRFSHDRDRLLGVVAVLAERSPEEALREYQDYGS